MLCRDHSDEWEQLQYPSKYLESNWPIRHCALSPILQHTNRINKYTANYNGTCNVSQHIALAGTRGILLYNRRARRWRVFGNIRHEHMIRCRALTWIGQHIICVANAGHHPSHVTDVPPNLRTSMDIVLRGSSSSIVSNGNDRTCSLLFFPRTHLDNASLLHTHIINTSYSITAMNVEHDTLVVHLANGLLLVYTISGMVCHQYDPSVAIGSKNATSPPIVMTSALDTLDLNPDDQLLVNVIPRLTLDISMLMTQMSTPIGDIDAQHHPHASSGRRTITHVYQPPRQLRLWSHACHDRLNANDILSRDIHRDMPSLYPSMVSTSPVLATSATLSTASAPSMFSSPTTPSTTSPSTSVSTSMSNNNNNENPSMSSVLSSSPPMISSTSTSTSTRSLPPSEVARANTNGASVSNDNHNNHNNNNNNNNGWLSYLTSFLPFGGAPPPLNPSSSILTKPAPSTTVPLSSSSTTNATTATTVGQPGGVYRPRPPVGPPPHKHATSSSPPPVTTTVSTQSTSPIVPARVIPSSSSSVVVTPIRARSSSLTNGTPPGTPKHELTIISNTSGTNVTGDAIPSLSDTVLSPSLPVVRIPLPLLVHDTITSSNVGTSNHKRSDSRSLSSWWASGKEQAVTPKIASSPSSVTQETKQVPKTNGVLTCAIVTAIGQLVLVEVSSSMTVSQASSISASSSSIPTRIVPHPPSTRVSPAPLARDLPPRHIPSSTGSAVRSDERKRNEASYQNGNGSDHTSSRHHRTPSGSTVPQQSRDTKSGSNKAEWIIDNDNVDGMLTNDSLSMSATARLITNGIEHIWLQHVISSSPAASSSSSSYTPSVMMIQKQLCNGSISPSDGRRLFTFGCNGVQVGIAIYRF
jgi:hypothetical protein